VLPCFSTSKYPLTLEPPLRVTVTSIVTESPFTVSLLLLVSAQLMIKPSVWSNDSLSL
jgi:hypothetical protein